jgi:hypothetical protein
MVYMVSQPQLELHFFYHSSEKNHQVTEFGGEVPH